jgi:hypothetical protein
MLLGGETPQTVWSESGQGTSAKVLDWPEFSSPSAPKLRLAWLENPVQKTNVPLNGISKSDHGTSTGMR